MFIIAIYTYDAGGERIIKHNATSLAVYENAKKVGDSTKTDFMLYPSGMLVFRPSLGEVGGGSYTKHYFAGSQRVSSKIGTTTNLGAFLQDWTLQENSSGGAAINLVATSQNQLINAEDGVRKVYTAFAITPPPTMTSNPAFVPVAAFTTTGNEVEQYYFHPDHLGSSNYITNIAGEVSQHTEYFAFGETFVEEHKNSHNSPYKFNGKELDAESSLYYYGARYYDPRISIWASVDPLAEKMPIWSPYSYGFQNPIKYKDADGLYPDPWWLSEFSALGRAAHYFLSAYITIKGNGWKANHKIKSGGRYGPTGSIDVVNIREDRNMAIAELWELKPASHMPGTYAYNLAAAQLKGYSAGLLKDLLEDGFSSVEVNTGTRKGNLPFDGLLPATITTPFFTYDIMFSIPNPNDGMIYYEVVDRRVNDWVKEVALASAFVLAVILVGPVVGPVVANVIRVIATAQRIYKPATIVATVVIPIVSNGQESTQGPVTQPVPKIENKIVPVNIPAANNNNENKGTKSKGNSCGCK